MVRVRVRVRVRFRVRVRVRVRLGENGPCEEYSYEDGNDGDPAQHQAGAETPARETRGEARVTARARVVRCSAHARAHVTCDMHMHMLHAHEHDMHMGTWDNCWTCA